MTTARDSTTDIRCEHCGDAHPRTWSHCPTTGGALGVQDHWLGRTVSNGYLVESVIGRGGMGVVYRARASDGTRVAVKCLHQDTASDADAVRRFQREAQTAAATQHDNVVAVMDSGVAFGAPYLVMEYLEGESLAMRLGRSRVLSPHVACRLMHQALAGLAAVHRSGVIHRDLKPGNVFLNWTSAGETQVKLLDFGVSKWSNVDASETKLTRTGVLMGTPSYMSPEQARGNPRFDHRADLYAIAAMLYECISGQVPFVRSNYHALLLAIVEGNPPPLDASVAILPRGLAKVVHRGLAVDPDFRYQSAAEFADALAPYTSLASRPQTPPVPMRARRDSGVTLARDNKPTGGPTVSQTVSMGAMRYLQHHYGPAAVAEVLTRLPSSYATVLIDGSSAMRCPVAIFDALLNEAEIEFSAGSMALAKAIGVEIADSATMRTLRWVKALSTQQLIESLPRVWDDLFSFGDVEVRALGEARCRVDVRNAHPESPARDTMMAGLLGRLFTFTGATGVDVYVSSGLTRGASIFRVGWQPPTPSPKSWE